MPLGNALRADELKVYRDSAGNYASPTWSLLSTISGKDYESIRDAKELMLDGSKWVGNRLGKIKPKLTLKGQYRTGDTDRAAFIAAHTADPATHINIAIADGPIATAGTVYDKFAMLVADYKETAQGDDIVEFELTLVLGDMQTYAPVIETTVS